MSSAARPWRWPTTPVVPPATSTQSSRPHGIVLDEARALAQELGLPPWWLNEQASVYVAPGGDPAAKHVFDHPGLRVSAASPEHLVAMKVLAARRRDAEDIRFLVRTFTSAQSMMSWPCAPRSSPKNPCPSGHGWCWRTSSRLV